MLVVALALIGALVHSGEEGSNQKASEFINLVAPSAVDLLKAFKPRQATTSAAPALTSITVKAVGQSGAVRRASTLALAGVVSSAKEVDPKLKRRLSVSQLQIVNVATDAEKNDSFLREFVTCATSFLGEAIDLLKCLSSLLDIASLSLKRPILECMAVRPVPTYSDEQGCHRVLAPKA